MTATGHAPGEAVAGVTVAFTVLAVVATSLRLYTRFGIVQNAGIDDVVIAVATVLSIVLTIAMCQQVKYGMGKHADTLTPNDNVQSLIWFWASVWIYYLALCFAKISIHLQYLRIFPDKKFRIACFTLMGVVIGWTFWAFFSAVFACTPIRHFWHEDIPGTCLNRLAVWFSNAAVNIVTDLGTMILPLPVLRSLNIPKKQKFILMIVFGLGGITCIISIMRLQGLYAISKSTDVSWDNPLAAIWSSLEVNVGILCSCLPTLKGCVSRYFPRLFTSAHGSKHVTPVFELTGNHGKSHASCTATRSYIDENEKKHNGRMSRLGKRLGPDAKDLKEMEDGGSDSDQSEIHGHAYLRMPGIQVTTIVEQEEERKDDRDEEVGRHESESIKGLVPTVPYERT